MDSADTDASAVGGAPQVRVCFSPAPRQLDTAWVVWRPDLTVGDAVACSGLLERHALGSAAAQAVGVWGRRQPLDHLLRPDDRVEIYRGLQVDPKEARRLRYRGQHKPRAKLPVKPTPESTAGAPAKSHAESHAKSS